MVSKECTSPKVGPEAEGASDAHRLHAENPVAVKTLGVRRSTRAYYQNVYQFLLAKSEIADRCLGDPTFRSTT